MSSAAAPVALITGATGGIGSAVARRLHREGMRVVVSSSSSVTQGQRLADELVPAAYIRADLTHPVQARHLVDETIKHFGQLDLLVNNAAAFAQIPHEDLEAVTPEMWRRLFDVNVIGAWCAIQAAQPALAAANGHIVNITSIAALRPMGASIPYAVSKAALGHMTALVAKALGPQVRANAVAPGLVITERTAEWAAARNEVEERAPLRRAGMPDDIADAVVALQNAPYVTGETIAVDGGLHLL